MANSGDLSDLDLFMVDVDLSEVTEELAGLINSVRVLDRQITESAMTGPQVVADFAELYPPAALFSPEILSTPIIYKTLRDWLISKGANLPPHSSRRVMMQLAVNLYSDDEEKLASVAIVKEIMNAGRRVAVDKLAYYIGMRFRERDSKFSGDLGESWIEYVAEYQQVARDYALSPMQKKQYLHNLLRGDAKRYYLDRVDNQVNNFTEAVRMIDNEYNSIVRQNRVKNHLAGLRLSRYRSEGHDDLASLEKSSCETPPWAVPGLRNLLVASLHTGLSFQQLYGELEAALHLAREANLANLRDKASGSSRSVAIEDSQVSGILFQAPRRYARPHKGVSDTRYNGKGRANSSSSQRFDPLLVMGCFNCDDPNHMVRACPKAGRSG
eukprot:IDg2786t1